MFISRVGLLVSILSAPTAVLGANGAGLYAEHCAICHGAELEGEPNWRVQKEDGSMPAPPHDDSGHTWHHADQMLHDYTRLGGSATLSRMGVTGIISGMPAFGDVMSDKEIDAVLNFIKSK